MKGRKASDLYARRPQSIQPVDAVKDSNDVEESRGLEAVRTNAGIEEQVPIPREMYSGHEETRDETLSDSRGINEEVEEKPTSDISHDIASANVENHILPGTPLGASVPTSAPTLPTRLPPLRPLPMLSPKKASEDDVRDEQDEKQDVSGEQDGSLGVSKALKQSFKKKAMMVKNVVTFNPKKSLLAEAVQNQNLQSHIHSTPQFWGRHVAATIDMTFAVLMPTAAFIYFMLEFSGFLVYAFGGVSC